MSKFDCLLSKGSIGKLSLRNRVVMSPIETLYASANGEVTQQIIEFYRRRARGGVGLIVVHSIQGNTEVDPLDPYAGSLRLDNNAYIPMLSDLVEAVHFEGAKIAALVSLGGGANGNGEQYLFNSNKVNNRVAPSDLNQNGKQSRALTIEEIKKSITEISKCASRAKQAGFDAFYIHAIGSYLLAEFLSPLFNKREDEYGGSAENRWRLLFELIAACKKEVGDDFPIIVRFSLDEMHPNGRSFEESLHFLPLLEKAGVSAIDVVVGLMDSEHRQIPSIYVEEGINTEYLKKAKETVSIPVISSGHMNNPLFAERMIRENVLDFIEIGRGLVADPDWVNKIQAQKECSIRHCLSCNYCIGHRIINRLPLRCAINPYAGREISNDEEMVLTHNPKRIVVIGAGPAGLEVTRVLGSKGHKVDLYEATDEICGGQIHTASLPPFKQNLKINISNYYKEVLKDIPSVSIHLNQELTLEQAISLDVDSYIIATGATPFVPNIEGIKESLALSPNTAMSHPELLGKKVVVLGGGQVGAETALFCAERGNDVCIVEQLSEIAIQEEPFSRSAIIRKLKEKNTELKTNKKVIKVTKKEVFLLDLVSKETEIIPYDTVICAFGMKSYDCLSEGLKAVNKNVVVVGDSSKVGNVAFAISQANYQANRLR